MPDATFLFLVLLSAAPYLPNVGPVPLRFATPPLAQPKIALPPLVIPEDPPEPPFPAPPSAAPAQPLSAPLPPPPELQPADPTLPPVSQMPAPAAGPPPVPPQMLLRFFSGADTNRPTSLLSVPVGFVPPPTVPPGSSKAQYSVGP